MKKIICAVLILVTILSLSGCVDTFRAFFPKESKDIERSTSSVKNTFGVIGGLSEAKEAFKDVDLDNMSEEELEELFSGVLK